MSPISFEFFMLLAVSLPLYYLLPSSLGSAVLLAASSVFYLSAGVAFFPFILFSTVSTYAFARLTEHCRRSAGSSVMNRKASRSDARRRALPPLLIGVILNVGMLVLLKLSTPSSRLTAYLSGERVLLILPLGISFYTLQAVGYLVDVYRGRTDAERSFFRLALFLCYFPQLTLGPISRYSRLAPQLALRKDAEWEGICVGALRMLWGCFKKVVVADALISPVRALVEGGRGGGYTALLAVIYSVRIYADFTGGADIAIGVSRLFGIRLDENFDRPFSSTSAKEFWNRWHITLGAWFTDYVFYPISVSRPMRAFTRWLRRRLGRGVALRAPVYLATAVTWLLTGLWHGISLNFAVWGMLNCLIILVSRELQPLYESLEKRFPRLTSSRTWRLLLRSQTFMLIGLVRLLDLYVSVPRALTLIASVPFDFAAWRDLFAGGLSPIGLDVPTALVVSLGVVAMSSVSLVRRDGDLFEDTARSPLASSVLASAMIFITLVFGSYGTGYEAGEFIYAQF